MSTVIDTLIYDRTQADVNRVFILKNKILTKGLNALSAEEKAEYMAGMKGAYNASDLNRVGQAIAYIADLLNGYGYSVQVYPKTDWTMSDTPTPEQLEQYLANVAALRQALLVLPTTPEVPADMEGLTIQEANDIEKILVDIDRQLTSMREVMLHAAQPFLCCGCAVYLPKEHLQVYTADDLPVDTADGKPVYAW